MEKIKIKCNVCSHVFGIDDIQICSTDWSIDECGVKKEFQINFFKCPSCGQAYITEMLDFVARRLKDKCLNILSSIDKRRLNGLPVTPGKVKDYEDAKYEASKYQKELIGKYDKTGLIPQSIYD